MKDVTKDVATLQRGLAVAMEALHDIGGAIVARRILADSERVSKLTVPLRESTEAKAMTDEQIEERAMDAWERVFLATRRL
jgi:hypothetical protein